MGVGNRDGKCEDGCGKRGQKNKKLGLANKVKFEDYEKLQLEERVALIQELIPLGLMGQ